MIGKVGAGPASTSNTANISVSSNAKIPQRDSQILADRAAAQSWAERGEEHRAIVYGITTAALKKVAHAPPPVESWRDVDFLDKIGRRSSGLDDSERNQNINIGMQLIEYRLSQINLAPDEPEALQEPPKDK